MKWRSRTIIFLLPLLLLGSYLKAQHAVGVIGGVNIPFVNFTDFVIDASYQSTVMPTNYLGVTYRYQSHKNVGFQLELSYAQKGWGQRIQDTVNTVENKINYIELPVYMRCTLLGDRNFNVNINVGAYGAYAISHKTSLENEDGLEQLVATYDINSDNRGDFGIVIGLGISYKFSFGYLQIEGGYKGGFANILPVNPFRKENPIVSTNQAPNILVSYLIPLKIGQRNNK